MIVIIFSVDMMQETVMKLIALKTALSQCLKMEIVMRLAIICNVFLTMEIVDVQ